MKFLLAQFRKDIALAPVLFWSWVACTAGQILLGLSRWTISAGPRPEEPSSTLLLAIVGLGAGGAVLQLAQFVLTLALAVHVVHADCLVDADAFWRTRPIARGQLLGAKALAITLLALGLAVCWLAGGLRVGLGNALWGSAHAGAFLLGLFAFAALTPSLTRLGLTYLGYALGSQAVAQLFWGALGHPWPPAMSPGYHKTLSPPGDWVDISLTSMSLVGFTAVILCQYLTLRTNASRLILGVTFLATALLRAR